MNVLWLPHDREPVERSGLGDDEFLRDSAVRGTEKRGRLLRSGEMMRHLSLSIEGEMVRTIEVVDLRGMPYCRREQNEFIVLILFFGPWPISCSARWMCRRPT